MTRPEPAAIKPEAKKVNVAAKPDKAGSAQIRVAEEARAARARTSCAKPEAAQLTLLALVAVFVFPPGGEDDPGPRLGRSSPL
jgi:hypothetical protein